MIINTGEIGMEYVVKKTTESVALEGKPVGPVWEAAAEAVLVDAKSGKQPGLTTSFRLLYDEEFLYIGYTVKDDIIVASYTDHDSPLYEEDVVEIFISPGGSTHFYYEFNFSPNAVVFDAIILNDGGSPENGRGDLFMGLKQWDCEGLIVATCKEDNNDWSVTVKIPFSQLHLADNTTPLSGDVWRANLFRIEYGSEKEEYSAWSALGRYDFHTSEKFGTLVFE